MEQGGDRKFWQHLGASTFVASERRQAQQAVIVSDCWGHNMVQGLLELLTQVGVKPELDQLLHLHTELSIRLLLTFLDLIPMGSSNGHICTAMAANIAEIHNKAMSMPPYACVDPFQLLSCASFSGKMQPPCVLMYLDALPWCFEAPWQCRIQATCSA